jgi:hypothetical protein
MARAKKSFTLKAQAKKAEAGISNVRPKRVVDLHADIAKREANKSRKTARELKNVFKASPRELHGEDIQRENLWPCDLGNGPGAERKLNSDRPGIGRCCQYERRTSIPNERSQPAG